MKSKLAIRSLHGIAALATTALSLPAMAINFTATPGGSITASTAAGSPAQVLKTSYDPTTPIKCDMAVEGSMPAATSSNGVDFLTITKVTFSTSSSGTDPIVCPAARVRVLVGGTLSIVSATNPLKADLTSYSSPITSGTLKGVYLTAPGLSTCGPVNIPVQYSNTTHVFTLLHPWSMSPDCSSVANINLTVSPTQSITSP
ncbi:hypothetical protein [Solimonas variicoloris]|uniref:hypothetical protein n=1 Tax=Solimonas variicoloris TaxID=254408 RepID=UPI00039D086F|nr:hypothetical protein [Solimonas variicoloris]